MEEKKRKERSALYVFIQIRSSRKIFPQSNPMKLNSGTCGILAWSLFCQSGRCLCFKSLLWFSQLLFPVKTFQSFGKKKREREFITASKHLARLSSPCCIQPRTVRKSVFYCTRVCAFEWVGVYVHMWMGLQQGGEEERVTCEHMLVYGSMCSCIH